MNFYTAEAAIHEGMQTLEDADLTSNVPAWVVMDPDTAGILTDATEETDLFTDAVWTGNGQVAIISNDAEMLSAFRGVTSGSSTKLGGSRLYSYDVYGRSQQNTGQSIIKMSYKKAY
jgi:hypothetical protein